MARGDRHHGAGGAPGRFRRGARQVGRWLSRLFLVLLLVAAGAGVHVWRTDRVDEVRDRVQRVLDDLEGRGDPGPTQPAAIAAPERLELAPVSAAPVVATAVGPVTTTSVPGAVRQVVLPALRDRDLGRHVLALVTDLGTGAEVFRKGSGAAVPASTTKILTAAAALQAIGPETRFTTQVVAGVPGTIVLVGGGDPFLARAPAEPTQPGGDPPYPARADLTTLAQQTAAALLAAGTTQVQVGYDDTLFPGPAVNPAWRADYVPDGVVSPITALWADEGRPADGLGRVADPSLVAAQVFVEALRAAGVTVTAPPTRGAAASTGQVLASIQGAPLREVVARVLEVSDNEGAEVLAHQVAVARGLPGTFADGAAAVTATLAELGVTSGVDVHDGSGLSRRNRIEPAALVGVLRAASGAAGTTGQPRLESLLTSLPVAGFTGSLADRFASAASDGRGVVRAKTGTLTGVDSLAGVVVDATGHPYLFALMADRVAPVDVLEAEAALDDAAGAIAACVCSR